MSIYNLMNGFNPCCLLFMPMLGRKQDEWPRFRDCFLTDDYKHIVILTRVGGGNRNTGYGEEELYEDPNFVKTWDDDFDSTYGYYEFKVPEKWQKDFDTIVDQRFDDVSDEYVNYLKEFFPKIAEAGTIDKIFRGRKQEGADG